MQVIMVSGKSCSGKDTVAKRLQEQLEAKGATVLIIHFGDPVKWIARDFYNWNGEKDEAGRSLLQHIGTETMRAYYPTYWAEIISKFIAAAHKWDFVIIPDWRFENEYYTVCNDNKDVTTIRINRYNNDGSPYINEKMTKKQANHISETELDHFPSNFIIENYGTLEDLYASVDVIQKDICLF